VTFSQLINFENGRLTMPLEGQFAISLVHAQTLRVQLFESNVPPFVALSHYLGSSIANHQLPLIATPSSPPRIAMGSEPTVAAAGRIAIEAGVEWIFPASIWQARRYAIPPPVRVCDDSVTARLSAFKWYRQAERCIVYLHDLDTSSSPASVDECRTCAWFSDISALPALLGSRLLFFYSSDWSLVPALTTQVVSSITRVPPSLLLSPSTVVQAPVAKIFHLASRFTFHSPNEQIDVLMGICGPSISTRYGGVITSFLTFQIQLFGVYPDDLSLLAWESDCAEPLHGVLADSISDFSVSLAHLWDDSLFALSVTSGRLCGATLEVMAFCCHLGKDTFMELFSTQSNDASTHTNGLVVRLEEVNGGYMRACPFVIEAAPSNATFVLTRIQLRIAALDPGTIPPREAGHEIYDLGSPAPSLERLLGMQRPTRAGASSLVESWVHSDSWSRHPKRSIFDFDTDDGVSESLRFSEQDSSMRRQKRIRPSWDERVTPRTMPPPPVMTPDEPRQPPLSEAGEDTKEPEGQEELGETESRDDGDTGEEDDDASMGELGAMNDMEDMDIFHGISTDHETLSPNHEFFKAMDKVVEHGWNSFLRDNGFLPPHRSGGGSDQIKPAGGVNASETETFSAASVEKFITCLAPPEKQLGKMFACPFYKFDPVRFRGCLGDGGFQTVRALKEHLAIRHRHPICCIRCQEQFESQEAYKIHQRLPVQCEKKKKNGEEDLGISDEHLSMLYQRQPDKTEEQRWFSVFETVLPDANLDGGSNRPASPYLTGQRERFLLLLQDYWETKGREVPADVLRKMGLLDKLLDEERALRLLHGNVAMQFYHLVSETFPTQ
jgi:hypothetical protein